MPRKRSTLARACAGLVALLISTPSAALSMSEPAAGESATRSGSPLYLSRAQAVETARTLEREAARATDRDRAISLLERAFSVRVHVGPKGQALRDLQTIERLYAAGDDDGRVSAEDQARAADAYWRRRDILLTHANGERDGAALRRHALGYLARHGEAGGIDRALLANLVIAERDWLRSCPKPGLAGLCVTWQPGESVAAAAARASIIEPSKRRLEEALRAKLRRELTPKVKERLEAPRDIWPEPRTSSLHRIRGTLAAGATGETRRPHVPTSILQQAVEREVERALPGAYYEALAGARRQRDAKPRRCHDVTGLPRDRVLVHRRDAALVKASRLRLLELQRLGREAARAHALEPLSPARRQSALEVIGKVELYLRDAELEALLGEAAPADLQFHVDAWKKDSGIAKWEREYRDQLLAAERSRKRLSEHHTRMLRKGQELLEGYTALVAAKQSPEVMTLAASRVGLIPLAWAVELRAAAIPAHLKRREHALAFCDVLTDSAEPIAQQARAALVYCVERATTLQHFNAAARWCEEAIARLDPRELPPRLELVGPGAR